jgi:hypothetical protein
MIVDPKPWRDLGFSCSHDNDNPCPSQLLHDIRVQAVEQQRIEMETRQRQGRTRRSLQSRCFKCDRPMFSEGLCIDCARENPNWSQGDVDRFLSHRWGEPVRFEGNKVYECSACHVWRRGLMSAEENRSFGPQERRFDVSFLWDGSSGCVEWQPQAPAAALSERPRLSYPQGSAPKAVIVSAFAEGHSFVRVEVHFGVDVDLTTHTGKMDPEKRRVFERIVERAIRAMDLDLSEMGRGSTDRVHGAGCPVDAPDFLGPCPGCGAEKVGEDGSSDD